MKASDSALIDEFCDALWLEDGLARNTLESYRRDIVKFGAWLAAKHGRSLLAAGHANLLGFLAHQVQHRAKATTASPDALTAARTQVQMPRSAAATAASPRTMRA